MVLICYRLSIRDEVGICIDYVFWFWVVRRVFIVKLFYENLILDSVFILGWCIFKSCGGIGNIRS